MLRGQLSQSKGEDPAQEEQSAELVTVLCIAYHNLAVEHEYLKNYEAAVCAYAEGVRWAMRFLKEGHDACGAASPKPKAPTPHIPPCRPGMSQGGPGSSFLAFSLHPHLLETSVPFTSGKVSDVARMLSGV